MSEKCFPVFFGKFPKRRNELPEKYLKIYDDEYLENRTSGGIGNLIARKLESWMHKKVASVSEQTEHAILEIGAGSLNHVKFEAGYLAYDVVEPFQKLLNSSKSSGRVRNIYSHLSEVPAGQHYTKIASIAVLEHLLNLPVEVARSALMLEDGGRFCAGVPSEGGWLWEMAWRYGTGPGFRKRTGLDYEVLMRFEHVNTVDEIEESIRYFFEDVEIIRFPLQVKDFSFYTAIVATRPIRMRCEQYLKEVGEL